MIKPVLQMIPWDKVDMTKALIHLGVLEIFSKEVDLTKTWKKNFLQIFKIFLEILVNKPTAVQKGKICLSVWTLNFWML